MKSDTLELKSGSSIKISFEDFDKFIGRDCIPAGEKRGAIKIRGPWSIITSYKALAVTATWTPEKFGNRYVDTYTLHGDRTMSDPRQSGYALEGHVSIKGERRSCFTSDILFELPDGALVSVAVIHVRDKKEPTK